MNAALSLPLADASLLGMNILIVDDEPPNVALLRYILSAAGFTRVRATTDPRQVRNLCQECLPDLILLDLMMPYLSGFSVAENLLADISEATLPAILVLTADITIETRHRALAAGASDFLVKPLDQVEVLLRIRNLLKIQFQHQQLTRQNDLLEERVRERTGELRQTLTQLESTVDQLQATQRQVIQHERLSALGAMAAGLAHDFNNALSLILGYGELLLEDSAADPPRPAQADFLHTIIDAAQDAASMFRRLRVFYRPHDEAQQLRSVDVNQIVRQAAAITRPRWHGQALGEAITITVELDLAPGLPALLAAGSELCEMLTNLIFNAIDAMPAGGRIDLRTSLQRAAPSEEAEPGQPNDEIVIEVADTGLGMPEEVRRRCLEPFFTTKGQQGNGLGLAMVYGTIQRQGGSVDVHSTVGVGTRFVVRLPLRCAPEISLPEAMVPGSRTAWRILVVDDQPAFVTLLEQYLANDHHLAESASNGEEALLKFRARPSELVITDRAMPGMSGEALAAEIKAVSPATRVILLTGFHKLEDEEGLSGAAATAADLIISKPITQASLRVAISRVMSGETAEAA